MAIALQEHLFFVNSLKSTTKSMSSIYIFVDTQLLLPKNSQNITQSRKSFIALSKCMIWRSEVFLKAFNFFLLWKYYEPDFGYDPLWSCFCQNSVLKGIFKSISNFFLHNYGLVMQVIDINWISWHFSFKISKLQSRWNQRGST